MAHSFAGWPGIIPVLFASLFASAIPAQWRKPVFVTVVDAKDRPIPNALVTLASGALLELPGTSDVVHGTTNVRGRCIARTIVGRSYSAWATHAESDHVSRGSEPVDFVASGALCELVIAHRVPTRRVAVKGLELCCPEPGRTVVHLPFPDAELAQVLEVDGGFVALPPAPWSRTWLGVRDANGSLLQVIAIEPNEKLDVVRFRLPNLTRLQVLDSARVITQEVSAFGLLLGMQRPSNAVIGKVSSEHWRAIKCRAVDDGIVEVPVYLDSHTDWLRLHAVGHSPLMVSDRAVLDPDHKVQLRPTQAIQGMILGMRPSERAYACLRAKFRAVEGSERFAKDVAVPVDSHNNALHLDLPSQMSEYRVVMHLHAERPQDGERPWTAPRLVVLEKQFGRPENLDVDLSKLLRTRISVVGPDGSLVAGAAIAVKDLVSDPEWGLADFTASTVGDLQGRADLLLGEGHWAIYTTDGTCHALAFVNASAGEEDLTITLEPAAMMSCRVVDAQGKPVRGARFERAPKAISGFGGVLQGTEGWTKEAIAAHVAEPMVMRVCSNRDGLLSAPIQSWRPWQMRVRVRAGSLVSSPMFVGARDLGEIVVE